MSGDKLFQVEAEQAQKTLAAALRSWLPGLSWEAARKLIHHRRVTVCGNVCLDDSRRLKATDVVKVLQVPAPRQPDASDVRLIYLDGLVAVVEKPPGLTSVRHREEQNWNQKRRQFQPTLDELVPRLIAQETGQKPKGARYIPVRPVHRLDRETSGIMVFARTVPAERSLTEQFRQHTVHRRYLAIVRGHVKSQTIETQLVRDRGDGRRGISEDPDEGKHAITHVEFLERLGDYSLIQCKLETGRTHQIRIHLSEIGHPLCGEPVYGSRAFRERASDDSGAPRLCLHAAELGFAHPTNGSWLQFESPMPRELVEFANKLRSKSSSSD